MSAQPLNAEEIHTALADLPGWKLVDGQLTLESERPSFPDAIEFVRQVGEVAEDMNHHPDIDIRWRTVTLAVCTHDAGHKITGADVELATRVNALD